MADKSSRLTRLGRKEIWGVPLLILAAWLYASMSFFFDVVRLNSWSPYWILIGVVSFAEVVGMIWVLRKLVLDRVLADGPKPWVNILVAGLVGAIKNVTVGFLAFQVGIDEDPIWTFRVIGGFGLGISIFVFCGLALGARAEHEGIMSELNSVQQALLNLRASSKARLKSANEALSKQTRDLLVPKLETLQGLLQRPGETSVAIESLRDFIQHDVRPLSESLSRSAVELSMPVDHVVAVKREFFASKVLIRPLIRVGANAINLVFTAFAISYMIMGSPETNTVTILSVLSIPVLILCKALIPRNLKLSRRRLSWVVGAVGALAAVPGFIGMLLEAEDTREILLLASYFLFAIGGMLGFAYSESLDVDRLEAREQVKRENQQLSHDLALFEQQVWLAHRAWQFVVHGTVQSALTAALTRLQSEPNPEQYILNRVVEDLERARAALTEVPTRTIDLPGSIAQLQSTWRGICDIKVSITDRASRALQKDNDACQCVNEIIKETVSNAVRHGEAKTVYVELDRVDDFNLEISVSNDGLPLRAQQQLGVGSRLIEELTTDWSLESSKASGLTVFKANLPLQRG